MLGPALDTAFRHLATLFCVCALIFVPLHLVHAVVFRNVIAVAELAPDIESFPEGRKVKNVGPEELHDERTTGLALLILEAGSLVILVGAARRVIEVEEAGGVATVLDAVGNSFVRLREGSDHGALAGWLTLLIGYRVAEVLGSDASYLGVGLSRGVAVSLAGAIVIGTAAASRPAVRRPVEKLDLY
ncbi:MAG TPA: hypothetical protein VG408_03240 [Actinomycetota bacterium]|nr:hypothetical protein [Actinomycetota bacterium]